MNRQSEHLNNQVTTLLKKEKSENMTSEERFSRIEDTLGRIARRHEALTQTVELIGRMQLRNEELLNRLLSNHEERMRRLEAGHAS